MSEADTSPAKSASAPPGPVASRTWSPGTVTIGSVVSVIWTVREPVAGLPAWSVAVQVTVVVPTGNSESEAGSHVTGTDPSTWSVAVGERVTTLPPRVSASVRTSGGSERTGAVVSTTVMVNSALSELPAVSTAEQVTTVAPSGKVAPDGVVQVRSTSPS